MIFVIIEYIIMSMILYSIFNSVFRYYKFKKISNELYKESMIITNNSINEVCHINGSVCKMLYDCTFDTFVDFIESYVKVHGKIHLVGSDNNNVFFNTLENHLIEKYCIIINGTAFIPKSYIEYIKIIIYLYYYNTNNIEYHIDNFDEELYEMYVDSLIKLQKLDEFKDVKDVVAISYSSEFGNKKIIWKNPDTNILYMNGYENNSISMLIGIMFYFNQKTTISSITSEINNVVSKFTRSTKSSLFMFVESNTDKIIGEALNACQEGTCIIDCDYTKELESNWMYSPFASSIWKYHNYFNKLAIKLKNNV